MKKSITIALDAMGGDYGYTVTVPAALAVLAEYPELRIILVGNEQDLKSHLEKLSTRPQDGRIVVRHASQVVAMDELPSVALRSKKDSSMRVAIDLVKSRDADACVSAGNTGALMATARFVLKTLPGIDRPAIIKTLPSREGVVRVLDLGANIDCSAENLFQFALMGAVFAQEVDKVAFPRVALLNVGQEEIKGNEQVKQASRLLAESSLNYIGYIEGDGIFKDQADVVVCDGFVGNISLKVIEGLAKMIASTLRQDFKRNPLTMLAGIIAWPVLRHIKNRLDPGRYNGATLLGLRGTVLKSHGSADARSFAHAIRAAIREVEGAVPEQIEKTLGMHVDGVIN